MRQTSTKGLAAPKRPSVPILHWFLAIAIGLVGLWQFHLPQFASNFDTFPGDRGDARLVAYLMEHWYRVFQGLVRWQSPAMFYPVEGTIGYADLMLGYGIVYSGLRTTGLGIFEAAEFTIIIFNFLNYLTCFVLLNKVLRFNLLASIAGAAFFAFNSPKLMQMNHLQLQPMLFLPLAIIGIVLLVQKRDRLSQKQAFGLTALSVLSLALQLMTGFYPGWFFIFWSSLFLVLTLLFKRTRSLVLDVLRKFRVALVAGVVVFVLALIPFVVAYLPIIKSAGGRPYEEIKKLIPVPRSFVLMGERNYVWGDFTAAILARHPISPELQIGFGLIPTVAWLGLIVFAIWFFSVQPLCSLWLRSQLPGIDNHRDTENTEVAQRNLLFLAQLIIATCFVYLVGTKYWNFSLWKIVYVIVPGAQAIRGVARYALMLALPMAIAFAFLIHFLIQKISLQTNTARRTLLFVALFVATCFGIIEQFHSATGFDGFSIKAENVYLNKAAQSFPDDCSSFYVAVKPTALHHQFEYQIDAIFLSLMKDVPAINGYSGLLPPNWHLWEVMDPGYENNVKRWIEEREIKGNVCRILINGTTARDDIADPEVFVRQQYLDILGREPDLPGYQAWLAMLNGCAMRGGRGANESCDRVNVSIGMLDSQEFRERSHFVIRLYFEAFGRRPLLSEFNHERAALVSAAPVELEAKKEVLIREVEQRTGAQVSRKVIEDPSAFRNEAFVLMQFFAHLNRDPYPFEYDARLKNLEATGNRRQLVADFLYSVEYRKRFGYVN